MEKNMCLIIRKALGQSKAFWRTTELPRCQQSSSGGQQISPETSKAPQGPLKLLRDQERSSGATKASQVS